MPTLLTLTWRDLNVFCVDCPIVWSLYMFFELLKKLQGIKIREKMQTNPFSLIFFIYSIILFVVVSFANCQLMGALKANENKYFKCILQVKMQSEMRRTR